MFRMMNLPGMTPDPIDDDDGDELLPMQEKFVIAYCDHNYHGTKAAISAGYAEAGAHVQACRLLKQPKIKRAVRLERKKRADAAVGEPITKEWIVERLAWLASASMTDFAEWGPEHKETRQRDDTLVLSPGVELIHSSELSRAMAYAVTEIGNTKEGVKIKLGDKRAALVDLAKLLGYVTDKVEHSGKVETSGPDIASMTPEQLAAYEAFLVAMSAVKGG